MTRRVFLRLPAVLLAAAAFVACSRAPETFGALSELTTAVSAAGVACDRVVPGPEAQLVADSGTCTGSGVMLYLFETAQQLDDWSKVGTMLGPALVGSNWAATGDAHVLERIASNLGGAVTSAGG